MRMRYKAWVEPELQNCTYLEEEPAAWRGRWREHFVRQNPLHLEIGCGKGVSTAAQAQANQDVNLIAVDEVRKVLGSCVRNIDAAYAPDKPENILLTVLDAAYIRETFAPEDAVECIYINFCNPWNERKKHAKRRLTHPRQLVQYRSFLVDGGEIRFKTDDDILFEDSMQYFQDTGFEITYITRDLHASGFTPNYVSEHEKKFSDMGIPIKMLIARKIDWDGEGDLHDRDQRVELQ